MHCQLMEGAMPRAADTLVLALGHPVLALLFLVPLQEGAGKLTQAEATLRRQLTHSFLHSQVAAAEALTDLATTVGARGLLLLQPGIC